MSKFEKFMFYLGAGMGDGYDPVDVVSEQPLVIAVRNRATGELLHLDYSEEFEHMEYEE